MATGAICKVPIWVDRAASRISENGALTSAPEAEPKRLRYQLLHVAARLAFSGRRGKLHLQHTWPWADELLTAFQKLYTIPAGTG